MTVLPRLAWDVDPALVRVPLVVCFAALLLFAFLATYRSLRRRSLPRLLGSSAAAAIAILGISEARGLFELRYYTVLMLAAFIGGYLLFRWQVVRGGGSVQDVRAFSVWGVLGTLFGARVGHGLFYEPEKLANPLWLLMVWAGGLASHGAAVGLTVVMWRFTRGRGVPFLDGADRFAYSAALGAALVRVGNLMNSEVVGRRTNQEWGIWFPKVDPESVVYRYPTQVAEAILGGLVLAVLFVVDARLGREARPRGALIATFFTTYFSGRFLIEFYKEPDGILGLGSLTTAQVLSIPGIIVGCYGFWWARRRGLSAGWTRSAATASGSPTSAARAC